MRKHAKMEGNSLLAMKVLSRLYVSMDADMLC